MLFSLLDAAIGGGQRVALEVAHRLVAEGDTLGLLIPGDGPAVDAFRGLRAEVHTGDLQTLRRTSSVAPAVQIAERFDVMYSHTSVPGEILGARVARRAGIAHVVHRHTDPHFSPNSLTRLVQRRLYRRELRETPFIAVAAHIAASLERLGIAGQLIAVVPNGVDVEATTARAAGVPSTGGAIRVGILGRFDRSRGMDTFAEAVATLPKRDDVAFLIGGSPGPFHDYEANVRRLATKAGIELVEPGTKGVEFLAGLDVVAIPSRYEGSPLTLFEAMALGKPIIASDIPGIREVLAPDGAGILVPPEDPVALARAIQDLVGDAGRRRELGRRAVDTVTAGYSLDSALDRIVEVLHASVR